MLIKAQKEITRISDDETINMQNYMESLNYISNLYMFINKLKSIVNPDEVEFLPTFYGKNTCMNIRIDSADADSEMRLFKISSPLFLVDKTAKLVESKMSPICTEIEFNGNTVIFRLK